MEEVETATNDNDEQRVLELADLLNKCINKWFNKFYKNEPHTLTEFKPCCDKDEIRIILECVNIYLENNSTADKNEVIIAVISYYYEIQVLEYYVQYAFDVMDLDCMKIFNSISDKIVNGKKVKGNIKEIIDNIVTSESEWASKIRRLILNLDTRGGKKSRRKTRRYRKKRTMRKKRKYHSRRSKK